MSKSPTNRNVSGSSQNKSSLLSSVKREQVEIDPLETLLVRTAVTDDYYENETSRIKVTDPVEIQAKYFLRNCSRQPMNLQDASLDIEGLFQLAEGGGWRRIVMYSNTMLADPTISKSIDLHKILMIRFYALFKLKLFDDLSQELGTSKGFGTNDHQLVAIKVLEAEIKVVTGRGNEAVEHMYTIINELEDIFTTSNSLKVFWKFVITGNVVNAILRMRNWKAAIDELQKLVESIEETLDRCHSVNDRHFYSSSLMIVLMRMALIHMQIGAIPIGKSLLDKASAIAANNNIHQNSTINSQLLLNEGIYQYSLGEYEKALDSFSVIIDLHSSETAKSVNILSTLTEQHKIGDMCEAEAILSALITSHCYEELILGSAVNNYSICALYLKRINQAIAQLESLIAINPPLYMIDPVVFNLCTLYDLSYAPDVSTTKKKSLQKVAIEFHIDDPILHWKSFRLN